MKYEYRIVIKADSADDVADMLSFMARGLKKGEIRDYNVRNDETKATLIAEKREHIPGFLDAVNDVIENGLEP